MMNKMKKILSLLVTFSVIACFSLEVFAMPDNTFNSPVTVSAGGSTYTAVTSSTTATRSTCYIRLMNFVFDGYSENYLPSGKYIYARLYTASSPYTAASHSASFNQPTSQGNYNYSYLTGYGGANTSYRLKTNSNWYVSYFAAFQWSANPY